MPEAKKSSTKKSSSPRKSTPKKTSAKSKAQHKSAEKRKAELPAKRKRQYKHILESEKKKDVQLNPLDVLQWQE